MHWGERCETCFNPRPCGRGDVKGLRGPDGPGVSIRAPAGGAIGWLMSHSSNSASFNPRPCGRGDVGGICYVTICFDVSIRAPAGGAIVSPVADDGSSEFQSAPLREGRSTKEVTTAKQLYRFNPRPCGRGDRHTARSCHAPLVSIRAPAGGAMRRLRVSLLRSMFQSAPLREGRSKARTGHGTYRWFQSAPLREGRCRDPHSGEPQ